MNHLIANGTDGIIVSGTTGESPTLTTKKKSNYSNLLLKLWMEECLSLRVLAPMTREPLSNLTKLAEQTGVNGIMLVVPYYNKPSQEGLYQHFKTIAEATSLPVILYNIPGRSSVNMSC